MCLRRTVYKTLMVLVCPLMFASLFVLMSRRKLCVFGFGRVVFFIGFSVIFHGLIFSNYLYPLLLVPRGLGYNFRISFYASLVGMILVCLGIFISIFWSGTDRSNA